MHKNTNKKTKTTHISKPTHSLFGVPSMDEFDDSNPFDGLMLHQRFLPHPFHHFFNERTLHSSNGTVLSKSYMSSTKYNDKGEPEHETYQTQSINHLDKNGHHIQEKQEAYKNSNGIEKAAHQRMLDDKGHKIVKERNKNTGEESEHNIYKGMKEKDIGEFTTKYDEIKEKTGFEKNYGLLDRLGFGGHRLDNIKKLGEKKNNNNNAPMLQPSDDHKMNNSNINNSCGCGFLEGGDFFGPKF